MESANSAHFLNYHHGLFAHVIIKIIKIARKPPVHAASDSFPLERSSEGGHLWSGLSSEFAGGDSGDDDVDLDVDIYIDVEGDDDDDDNVCAPLVRSVSRIC